ncbi:MAG: hypothetical protein AB7O62_17680 [Pirellulales bacterium]
MATATQPGPASPLVSSRKKLGGQSSYERVASGLLATITLVGLGVVILVFLWLSVRLLTPPAQPIIELPHEDDFGGFENGVFGESMQVDGPPMEEIARESDLFQEPALEKVVANMVDTVALLQADLDDPSLVDDPQTGGQGGSVGDGNAPALGEGGGGKGGVRRGTRWVIRYLEGGSLEDYARQLDFFGVELGVMAAGDQVQYAANLVNPRPTSRNGTREGEQRLFFSWRDGTLQRADRELLQRAGIDTSGKSVLQFYTKNVEDQIATQEMLYLQKRFPGRDLRQVRRTFLSVKAQGNGYIFEVTDQTYF